MSHIVKDIGNHVGSSGASFGKFIYFIVFQDVCMCSNFLNSNFMAGGFDGLNNVSNYLGHQNLNNLWGDCIGKMGVGFG